MKYTIYIKEEKTTKTCVEAESENEAVAKAYISKELGVAETVSYASHISATIEKKDNMKKLESTDWGDF